MEVRTETHYRRVRVMVAGEIVADTLRPLLVWEIPYYPTYYFALEDVAPDVLVEREDNQDRSRLGEVETLDVVVGDDRREAAAYRHSSPAASELEGYVAFRWDEMDHWFEEDDEVFVHARSPYTRVDVLRSSREVRVEVGGVEVARSNTSAFLYETGLPVRYYLPKTDVRFDLLTESATVTHCPYKGQARYWSIDVDGEVHTDVVWGYDAPLPEAHGIGGLVCFYSEKLDVYVDGDRV